MSCLEVFLDRFWVAWCFDRSVYDIIGNAEKKLLVFMWSNRSSRDR